MHVPEAGPFGKETNSKTYVFVRSTLIFIDACLTLVCARVFVRAFLRGFMLILTADPMFYIFVSLYKTHMVSQQGVKSVRERKQRTQKVLQHLHRLNSGFMYTFPVCGLVHMSNVR